MLVEMLLVEEFSAYFTVNDLAIGLNFIIIYLGLKLAINFLQKSIPSYNEPVGRLNLALSIGFCFLSFIYGLKVGKNVWFENIILFSQVLFVLTALIGTICVAILEPLIRKRRLFTWVGLIAIFLFMGFPAASPFFIVPMLLSLGLLVFPVLIIKFLYRQTIGEFRRRLTYILGAAMILVLGVLIDLEDDASINFSSTQVQEFVGVGLVLLALFITSQSFQGFDVVIESGWRESIDALYIIHRETLQPLYYQNLAVKKARDQLEPSSTADEQLAFFSGGLVGIDSILKEASHSKAEKTRGISLIEQKDAYLLIEHSQVAIICLKAKKNLASLRFYLRKIRDAWETYYCTRMIDWANVKTEIFTAMNGIVNNILESAA